MLLLNLPFLSVPPLQPFKSILVALASWKTAEITDFDLPIKSWFDKGQEKAVGHLLLSKIYG